MFTSAHHSAGFLAGLMTSCSIHLKANSLYFQLLICVVCTWYFGDNQMLKQTQKCAWQISEFV